MKKRIISALLVSTVVLSTTAPLMAAKADSTDSQIAQQNSTIASATSASAQAQSQVDSLQSQVNDLKAKQASMTAEINKLQAESLATTKQITTLTANIKQRSKSLDAQARSAQVDGSATNYLDVLLNSKSLSDAIQKVTAMATVASANKQMLNQQESDKNAMESKLAANMKKYDEATKLQQQVAAQAKELTTQQAQLKVAQLSYQLTITNAQSTKQSLLDQKAKAQAAADAAAAAQKAAAAKRAEVVAASTKTVTAPATSTTTQSSSSASTTVSSSSTAQNVVNTPASSTTNSNTTVNSNSDEQVSDSSSSSSSNSGSYSYSATNPYPAGQCTAFVWQYFGGKIPTYAGNAADWSVYANSGAAAGTIAVFAPGLDGAGGFGHVAVVLSVSGSNMTIIEGNFNGGWGTTRTVPTAGVQFIRP